MVAAHLQAIWIPAAGEVTTLVISPVQVMALFLAATLKKKTGGHPDRRQGYECYG